jgi:hypothetical protein
LRWRALRFGMTDFFAVRNGLYYFLKKVECRPL